LIVLAGKKAGIISLTAISAGLKPEILRIRICRQHKFAVDPA